MKKYLSEHLSTVYLSDYVTRSSISSYQNKFGWTDYYIGEKILFSHRETAYDPKFFPEKLHSHPFFEIDIYIDGAVSYIADNREFMPQMDDILIIPPNCQHTAHLNRESMYKRYVLYFDVDAFDFLGKNCLSEILKSGNVKCLCITDESRAQYYYQRERLIALLRRQQGDVTAEVFACVLQILSLIANATKIRDDAMCEIPPKVYQIKEFIDTNYVQIKNTNQIAQQLFYSREHISRLFKQYYNTDLSEYLLDKKISCAMKLLEKGNSVVFSCEQSGFHNMSAFIQAFRIRTGMTPAKYKQSFQKNNRL